MRLVHTLHGGAHAILDALADLSPGPGTWAEVRLDSVWNGPPEAEEATDLLIRLLETAPVPLVATLRPKRQGGAFDGPEEVRLGLLVAAAQAGFHAVDLEADLQHARKLVHTLHEAGAQVIASDHTLPTTPARDAGLQRLTALQDTGADLQKLAIPVTSFADHLRCLELAHVHHAKGGAPIITPLGGGAPVRALLALAGNQATYGHATGPVVSGQPAAAHIAAIWQHWGLLGAPAVDRPGTTLPAAGPAGVEDGAAGHAADHGSSHAAWLAVLGHPVAHSRSPAWHNERLAARKERFGALDVPDSAGVFRLLCTVAPRIGLAGASVTHPHKQHAFDVARRDAVAEAVGAVNCLRFTEHGAVGTNTDATAFLRLLEGTRSVAILGAGGAARAAVWAAQRLDIPVRFHARREVTIAGVTSQPWDERDHPADTWIQATPLAQAGLLDAGLEGCRHVIELVYADGPTPLQQEAEARGLRVTDGTTFLAEQAADAYRYWFGDQG